jgi:hypothetical protein
LQDRKQCHAVRGAEARPSIGLSATIRKHPIG